MKKYLPIGLLAALVLAFGLGVVWLFELRMETGDVYPAYSSLRSDPLGTMAIYESLERIPGLTVQRDYRMSNELPDEPGTLYLHLGARAREWEELPEDLFRELDGFLGRGGRLVIAFTPITASWSLPPPAKKDETGKDKTKPEKPTAAKKVKKTDDPDEDVEKTVSLKDKWGVTLDFVGLKFGNTSYEPATVHNVSDAALPAELDWHSGMIFTHLDSAWKTIYARDQDAVLITRQFGPGTVVLASDAYFLSNEALSKDRQAGLLAWMVGGSHQVVFDEAHFGIMESPGVAALIRKYRLFGLVAGLLLLAGLFAWKNSSSLVPIPEEEKAGQPYVAGKDAAAGFVNLLRRNVPEADLPSLCFEEWKKSAAGSRHQTKMAEISTLIEAEKARPARQRNPADIYRRIAVILKQTTFSKPAPATTPPPLS